MGLDSKKIGIVGAGLIGAGWAAFFASHGYAVSLYDIDESAKQAAAARTKTFLAFLRDHGLLAEEEHELAVERVSVADDLADAVSGARLVQESVAERYDVKKDIFRQIDRASDPETIVASSSSGLLISELQSVMDHPGRSLIAHPFNPPHLIPLVELVPGKATTPETMAEAKQFYESLGKVSVVLNKEVPGHIANRLQAALWREAIDLVIRGVASVADVDKALAAGPGVRWALLGPHMIFHLGGGAGGIEHFVRHVGTAWNDLWSEMASWESLPPETAEVLARGVQEEAEGRSMQEIARWRDEKVVQLLKVIYDKAKQ